MLLKEKVLFNAKSAKKEQKRVNMKLLQRKARNKIAAKTKAMQKERNDGKFREYEFPDSKDIKMVRFFTFPKSLILTREAVAIYPVLCSIANFREDNWFHISINDICKMAGVSSNTVLKGIKDLLKENITINSKDFPLFEKKQMTEGERTYNQYRVKFLRMKRKYDWDKGIYFPFHRSIIESQVWASLTPQSKALYIAMRMHSYFDKKDYEAIEQYDYPESFDIDKDYLKRKWENCNTPMRELCNVAGIKYKGRYNQIKRLIKYGLIENLGYGNEYRIWLHPRFLFNLEEAERDVELRCIYGHRFGVDIRNSKDCEECPFLYECTERKEAYG